jgi:cellulose synthase/poly-beta-1,6-N-acetylglucosamine synthase-like glycosyltransferase
MKVSFSIPAYNEETVIAQCIQSVLAEIERSRVTAEVVVINNASTDRTKEIASSFPGVRVIDEYKKGLTHARAAGMHATDGDIIANVDSDTMLPPGWLTFVVKKFTADERLVALSGPFIYYDLSVFDRALVRFFYGIAYLFNLFTYYVLRAGAMLQGGNFVIRRTALERIGGFDTTISFYGEDTDIACRLAKAGNVLWTWQLPMYTSGRRIKIEGIALAAWRYTLNHFFVVFFKRPATKCYKDIRPSAPTTPE